MHDWMGLTSSQKTIIDDSDTEADLEICDVEKAFDHEHLEVVDEEEALR